LAYKLLALDLDGTLLDKNHALTTETIHIINEIKMLNVRVLIATGRMFISAAPFIKKLDLYGPMITYNGAYIKDSKTDEVLYHKPVDKTLAKMLIKEARENNLHIQMYHNDNLYVESRNEIVQMYEKISGIKATCLEKLTDIEGFPTKLLIIENNRDKFKYCYKYLKDNYNEKLEITESMKNFIEVGAKGVNKGLALANIAEKFNIKRDEIVSAGDSWNDIEMIEYSGTGITMSNSPEEVQKKADIIAPSENDGGLNQILKNIFALK